MISNKKELSRIYYLEIENFRSIKDKIHIDFPTEGPLVIIGANNAGKSNIVRALDLIIGEFWPKSHQTEIHEFWNRDPQNGAIKLKIGFKGVLGRNGEIVSCIDWQCNGIDEEPLFTIDYINEKSMYVNNQIREQCTSVMIAADRKLSYQMSYASKYTLLSKLMRKFHAQLISDPQREAKLKEKFEELKELFKEVSEFTEFQQGLQTQFEEMLFGMAYKLGIDFSAYDPSNYFHSLKIFPCENDQVRTFEELGTGQEQVLALAFAHAYAKAFYGGLVLIIEEPEAHLHPLAQLWLAKKIETMSRDGLQVVITTHSPYFIDVLNLPNLIIVRKNVNVTKLKQISSKDLTNFCIEHGANAKKTNENNILSFYKGNSTTDIMSGFFSRKIIFVEGQSEQLALPIYLNKVGFDIEKEGISIIGVLGKGNLAKWWRFYKAYDIPIYIIFDNDTSDDSDGRKRKDILITLGEKEDNLGDLLSIKDWLINDKFTIFGKDFEETMKNSFDKYQEIEKKGIMQIGDSKPLLARFVAENLEYDSTNIGWKKLKELAQKINSL